MAPPPGPALGAQLAAGTGRAVALGALVFLAMAVLAAVLGVLAVGPADPGAALRAAGLAFFTFHHVGIQADTPAIQPPGSVFPGTGAELSATVSFAFLLATLLAAFLLARAGRSVARRAWGAPWWVQALSGAKVGVPYAVLAFAFSLAVGFTQRIAPNPLVPRGGELHVGPDPVSALLWPLALGVVAGAFGGLAVARVSAPEHHGGRFVLAMVRGGWRMVVVALVLSFVGMLATVAVNPDAPFLPFGRPYIDALGRADPRQAASILLLTALALPNLAMWFLVPALGSSLGLFGPDTSYEFLSYTRFPLSFATAPVDPLAGGLTPPDVEFGTAPLGYFAFLLVPLFATIAGGRAAARSAGGGAGARAAVGAGAGVVFALAIGALAALATIGVAVTGTAEAAGAPQHGSAGPRLGLTVVLALAWGVIGGAIGALTASGRERARGHGAPGLVEPR